MRNKAFLVKYMNNDERRRFKRVLLTGRLSMRNDIKSIEFLMFNISKSGISVNSVSELQESGPFTIFFEKANFENQGEIVWQKKLSDRAINIGIQFIIPLNDDEFNKILNSYKSS